MRHFFNRHLNKIVALTFVFIMLFGLTSCRQGNWSQKVYTTYGAEFDFEWWGQAITGWPIAIISYPIAWLCSAIGKGLGNSYAWGIIFTTLIVRTIAWPIYSKQNGTSIKMTVMQPEMEKIQRKYYGRTDPESKNRMNQEMMSLYKKYKFNPFGCFFTMILQFPIFMAMYEVVRRINLTTTTTVAGGIASVETAGKFALINTKLFNYFELNTSFYQATTTHDKVFAVVIALMFGAVTIISQKLATRKPSYQKNYPNKNPKADDQAKQMKMMNSIMTVMFVIMSLSSTSLALYWLIGGIYQLGQSQVGRIMNERNYYKMKVKM